jgi:hypothetical protein
MAWLLVMESTSPLTVAGDPAMCAGGRFQYVTSRAGIAVSGQPSAIKGETGWLPDG